MPAPERRSPAATGAQGPTPEGLGRPARAAALRPLNVMVLVIGAVFFLATLAWWVPPLTLATYGALVFLGTRDPTLQRRAQGPTAPPPFSRPGAERPSPERRARWLPRGETRQKVEAALVEYRKVVAAIEGSDDVTRAVLEDSVPRLHAAADRLVDVAGAREEAAQTVRDLRKGPAGEGKEENLRHLQSRIGAADAEISDTSRELLDLRAKVVRVSLDAADSGRAEALNASLDDLNARLEALADVASPRQSP